MRIAKMSFLSIEYNYKEIYHYLLKPDHFEQLQALMKEQNIYETLNVKEALLKDEEFPYVLFSIETDQVFAAQMVGLLLEIDSLVPEYTEEYYLPVIAMARNYDSEINHLINQENSVAHELIHIRDILSLIEDDPSYIQRLNRYGINVVEDVEDLQESIDFEVFKIFHLEPQAFESDFSKGERTIRTLFLGKILAYECETEQEYVEMQMRNYVGNLSGFYKEKFPDEDEAIEKHIKASVIKYGKDIFGEEPLQRLEELHRMYSVKMLRAFGIKSVER